MTGGRGHCLCGAVAYAYEGAPNWQVHCHCESCRRATSSPFTSFFAVRHDRFRWTGAAPVWRPSSQRAMRAFCGVCGSPMAYQSLSRTEEIDLYAASLDDPSGFRATEHVHWNERLPWLHLADGLPVRRSPRRLTQDDDPTPVLALIRATFAYMDGRIDPPSSIHAVTPADVTRQAETGEIWVLDEPGRPVACVFLTLKSRALYVGKLAVDPAFRRQGLARQLIGHAVARAHVLGCDRLELQSRVELVENHRAFRAMGFKKTGETAHPGYDRPTSFTFTKTLGDS